VFEHIYIIIGGVLLYFLVYGLPGPALEWRMHTYFPYFNIIPRGPYTFQTLLIVAVGVVAYQRGFAKLWALYDYNKYAGW
jgi:hypothetical protein